MKNIITLLATAAVAALSLNAFAQTVSPVQSTARPFGLDIVDKVQLAGSDDAAATFQSSILPGLASYLSSALPEGSTTRPCSSIRTSSSSPPIPTSAPTSSAKGPATRTRSGSTPPAAG